MDDHRVIPEAFSEFCLDLGSCFIPRQTKKELFRSFKMTGNPNELNRLASTPTWGHLPQTAENVMIFLKNVDAELCENRLKSLFQEGNPHPNLGKWLTSKGRTHSIDATKVTKVFALEDYVDAGYIQLDINMFHALESQFKNDVIKSCSEWKKQLFELKQLWSLTKGIRGLSLLPRLSRLLVEVASRFNSHPPEGKYTDQLAIDLFKMLKAIERQSDYKRYRESKDDAELRRHAMLVRAMQYHAGRSISKARYCYRQILSIASDSDPRQSFLLDSKIPPKIADRHAAYVLQNVLCFEVWLGTNNFGDDRWNCLDLWLADLQERVNAINDPEMIIQCFRIEAEWHLCHLGYAGENSSEIILRVENAKRCINTIRNRCRGPLGDWMECELLKLQFIINVAEGKRESAIEVAAMMYQHSKMGKLSGQNDCVSIMLRLIDRLELCVQFGIQLHRSIDVLAQLKADE